MWLQLRQEIISYFWFKCDSHVTGEAGRHGSRRVKIDGDEILQMWRDSDQLAVVDCVCDISEDQPLPQSLSRGEIFELHHLWLAGERAPLQS